VAPLQLYTHKFYSPDYYKVLRVQMQRSIGDTIRSGINIFKNLTFNRNLLCLICYLESITQALRMLTLD
jgi:hypothetical protein